MPPPAKPTGDAANGERIFRAQCSGCHLINGRGGVLGPDLSRIGVARTSAALTRQIRGAVEDFRDGYEPVTVTTAEGRTVRGTRKNDDLFSVQVMDSTERLQGYVKAQVKTVTEEKRSLMPAYSVDQLNEKDLGDLIELSLDTARHEVVRPLQACTRSIYASIACARAVSCSALPRCPAHSKNRSR